MTGTPRAARAFPTLALAALVAGSPAAAMAGAEPGDGLPLWEVGVVGFGGNVPDWPAAGRNGWDGVVLPLVVYRGDWFTAGEGSIAAGKVLDTGRVRLDVSLDASFDADSDDGTARRGMPDLDFLFEAGPQLEVLLADFGRPGRLELEGQVRAVFSTDFTSVDHQGWVLEPALAYRVDGVLAPGTEAWARVAAAFASEGLADYFYEVPPAFAAAGRPAFDARAGYVGTELQLGFSHPLTDRVRLFGAGQVGLHQGARNDGSPLFEDETTYGFGLGVAVSLFQSGRRVAR